VFCTFHLSFSSNIAHLSRIIRPLTPSLLILSSNPAKAHQSLYCIGALDDELVGFGAHVLDDRVGGDDGARLPRRLGQPLQRHRDVLLLGLRAQTGVVLDAVEEVLAALAVPDVLDAEVDALLDVAAAHLLVDDHADRVLRHVVDAARLAVVALVRHALVDGAVALDIHDVADLVHLEVSGEVLCAMLPEAFSEHIAGTPPVSLRVRHGGLPQS